MLSSRPRARRSAVSAARRTTPSKGSSSTKTRSSEQPEQKSVVSAVAETLKQINADRPFESSGEILGKKLGAFAGRLLGRITGVGDYSVDLPSGGSPVEPTVVPQFIKSDSSRGTRIRHREYLGDVYASATAGAFSNTSYPLNPGSYTSFPWLASIAQQYDQWKPHGMAVVFRSTSSTYSATQSLGVVCLATDYDVYDSPYVNRIQAENSEFAVSGPPSQCLLHPIECDISERLTTLLSVRTSALLPTGDNLRFYDLGNLQVSSSGCLANQLLGELWITYDIELFKPQIPTAIGGQLLQYSFGTASNTTGLWDGGVTYSNGNSSILQLVEPTKLSFNPSLIGTTFLLLYYYPASGTATLTGTPTLSGRGITFLSSIGTSTRTSAGPGATGATASFMLTIYFTIGTTNDATPPNLTIATAVLAGGTGAPYVNRTQILQCSPNLVPI